MNDKVKLCKKAQALLDKLDQCEARHKEVVALQQATAKEFEQAVGDLIFNAQALAGVVFGVRAIATAWRLEGPWRLPFELKDPLRFERDGFMVFCNHHTQTISLTADTDDLERLLDTSGILLSFAELRAWAQDQQKRLVWFTGLIDEYDAP